MKTVMNLVIIYDSEKILLAMKKRGFGMGLWNGYGGKVNEGETIVDAAKRELEEESGIVAHELVSRGVLNFSFEDSEDVLEGHIFSVNGYTGEAVETEEMRPQWFRHSEIPFDQMWKDDKFWLPHFLAGKNIRGAMHFNNAKDQEILNNTIEAYE